MWKALPEKYKKIMLLVLIVGIVYLGFRFLLPLFFPFLLAFLIARYLRRPVRFLWKRFRMKPAVSGAILLFLFFAVVGGSVAALIKLLLSQFALLVSNYEVHQREWQGYIEGVCVYCDSFFKLDRGSTFSVLNDGLDGVLLFFREELIPFLTKHSLRAAVSVTELVAAVIIIFVSVLLLLTDMVREERPKATGLLSEEWREIKKELSGAGSAYVKTQLILISLVSLTCSLGFLVLKNPYALLHGVLIGVFDAFPVLGSAMILVPWAIISFVRGKIVQGMVLLIIYGICQFLREYLEPKLLGGKMGMRPIHSLMSVYIGYELFGIPGLFLGPIGLVLIKSVCKVLSATPPEKVKQEPT